MARTSGSFGVGRPLAALVVVLGLMLAGCAPSAPAEPKAKSPLAPTSEPAKPAADSKPVDAAKPAASPQAAAKGEATTVTFAVGNNLNHVPAFVGVERGIFLKHGIDAKLKVLSTGQEMSRALQAGEAQFIGAAVSNTPLAREEGLPVVGVVGYMHDATTSRFDEPVTVVARKEAGVGTGELEKLVGKKVGMAVAGTGDQYIRTLMSAKQVPQDKVEWVNVAPGNQLSALQTGQVDAIAAWEPYGSLLLDKVPGSVLVSRGGGHIGYFIMVSVHEDTIKQKPELVERFVAALAEASQWTRQNQDAAAEISTRWIPGTDVELLRKAIKFMQFDPRMSKHSIANYDESVQLLVEQKKLKSPIKASEAVNTTFVEKLMKEQPALFADLKPIP